MRNLILQAKEFCCLVLDWQLSKLPTASPKPMELSLDQKIQIWNAVGTWVAGLATFLAVIVSLYLARASQRIKLVGYCGLRTVITTGLPTVETVTVNVTNVGTRSAVVSNISLRVGRFRKKRQAMLFIPQSRFSDGIPKALADGQTANFGFSLGERDVWMADLCNGFIRTTGDVKTLHFHVHTTHGQSLALRPEKSFIAALSAALEKNTKGEATTDAAPVAG